MTFTYVMLVAAAISGLYGISRFRKDRNKFWLVMSVCLVIYALVVLGVFSATHVISN